MTDIMDIYSHDQNWGLVLTEAAHVRTLNFAGGEFFSHNVPDVDTLAKGDEILFTLVEDVKDEESLIVVRGASLKLRLAGIEASSLVEDMPLLLFDAFVVDYGPNIDLAQSARGVTIGNFVYGAFTKHGWAKIVLNSPYD